MATPTVAGKRTAGHALRLSTWLAEVTSLTAVQQRRFKCLSMSRFTLAVWRRSQQLTRVVFLPDPDDVFVAVAVFALTLAGDSFAQFV